MSAAANNEITATLTVATTTASQLSPSLHLFLLLFNLIQSTRFKKGFGVKDGGIGNEVDDGAGSKLFDSGVNHRRLLVVRY